MLIDIAAISVAMTGQHWPLIGPTRFPHASFVVPNPPHKSCWYLCWYFPQKKFPT
jgi:hypothetical protein